MPTVPRFALAALCALVAVACARNNDSAQMDPEPGPPSADTLAGRVAVVGSEPLTFVVLQLDERQLRLVGEEEPMLRRVAGAHVWIEGVHADEQGPLPAFHVRRFAVRSVDDMPAADGILLQEEGRFFLLLQDGSRHPIATPPAALREHLGARVWVVGQPGSEPAAFGLIRPAGR